MKRMIAVIAALPIALSALAFFASAPAHADDNRICRSSIGPKLVEGNVIVPRGATCTLRGTRVEGNVEVRRGARLYANGVKVDGNIQAWRAKRVVVQMRDGVRTRVNGNIQLLNGGSKGSVVAKARVNGDIQLFSNNGRMTVRGNIVDGNLQCKSNSPKPVGANNRVDGNKEGQCRRM